MYKLKMITSTTRNGKRGILVANRFLEIAKQYPEFEVELLDLAEINLPLMDEPFHPRLQKYQYEHTKAWSTKINEADAFVFVTAEYNHSYTAPLKNAIDYLLHEWSYKPVGFISYGGVAGGTRAVTALKPVVTALKMVPLPEAVHIPFFEKFMDKETHQFHAEEGLIKSAELMLNELTRWAGVLKPMREKA